MFKTIQQAIEIGDLKKALKNLREIGSLKELSERDLLTYFQLSRRLGDFHYGALQLEKMGSLFPELEIEKAFFLGELGATKQAVRLLEFSRGSFSEDFEVQRYLQMGNFLSVMHDYEGAIKSYQIMESFALRTKPILALVARLNILGHMIYSGNKLQETYTELLDFAESKLIAYPLIQQGAYYFLSLAAKQMNQHQGAKKFLQKAVSLGVKHRMRESLLLELTAFELNPAKISSIHILELKNKIQDQVHIVYLDQFNKIQGILSEINGEFKLATHYYAKVIFGGRKNKHFDYCLTRYKEITGRAEIPGWQYGKNNLNALTPNQIVYNKLERRGWPLLSNAKDYFPIEKEGQLISKLTLHLIRNSGFAMRDAEVWEQVWEAPFNFISSPTVIRSTLTRWRKSELGNYAEVIQKDRRLSIELNSESKLFIPF